MHTIRLDEDFGGAIMRAAGALRRGGIIVYPTDTLYGLGADALSDAAVARLHALKGSTPAKPTHCVVADLAMAEEYAEFSDVARKYAEEHWPGPLTLILKKKPGIDTGIGRGMDTIGIRVPDNQFCIELAKAFGQPYTTTSANKTGQEPQATVEAIIAQLGKNADIELAVDAGPAPRAQPSTIVNLVSGQPVVMREGAIPAAVLARL